MYAREIHAQAEKSREEKDYVLALKYIAEAIVAYQQAGDYAGLAEVITSRFLVHKLLYFDTQDQIYVDFAKHDVQLAVEIAEKIDDQSARALPYFNIAQFYDEFLEEYEEATKYYSQAISIMQTNPSPHHMEPGVFHNMQICLYSCQYKMGNKDAIVDLQNAINSLNNHPNQYEKDVWMSGGYMKMADILRNDNPGLAQQSLQNAGNIINSNPQLTIRKEQWERLAQSFSQ